MFLTCFLLEDGYRFQEDITVFSLILLHRYICLPAVSVPYGQIFWLRVLHVGKSPRLGPDQGGDFQFVSFRFVYFFSKFFRFGL